MMRKQTLHSKIGRGILQGGLSAILLLGLPVNGNAQEAVNNATATTQQLVKLGFENVRWIENDSERVYTVENAAFKLDGVGIKHAVDLIRESGLPADKPCKLIITHLDIPQLTLSYDNLACDTVPADNTGWNVSYEIDDSWKSVKKVKKQNSSFGKVDILVYPQLYFKNLIITQIYQVLLEMSPAVEVALWPGMKATGQLVLPVYNDGYGTTAGKVHPGYLTLEQNFRLPYNAKATATAGIFDYDTYGLDLKASYPFKDQRFRAEARLGLVKFGYWDGFKFKYNGESTTYWSVGGDFYWPQFNTQFKLRGEQYILKEKGIKFEMLRHFRYATVGFYAMKAEHASSNGGFKFFVTLPPYKQRRSRNKLIPRVSTALGTGITYNAGNEQFYYRMPYSNASENMMQQSRFNPYFIKSEL
jgi:hypothetical protein